MITLDEINELKENNKIEDLILYAIEYKDTNLSKPLNGAIIDTIENLGLSGNIEKVEKAFCIWNIEEVNEEVLFKLFEVQAKYSNKGPLTSLLFIDRRIIYAGEEEINQKLNDKIDSYWVDFIDRLYTENKTACEVNCFIYTGMISNKVSLKCIDTLAKLGEFSSIKELIVDRFPYVTGEFRSEIENVIKKYDKGVLLDIPSILKSRKTVKSEKEMLKQ